jgi:ABC-type Co2+ transport system permease subunit
MSEMLANIIIMALILGYCAYIIYKNVKNAKEGKHMGCSGCSGNCGSCGAAFNKSTAQSSKKRLK